MCVCVWVCDQFQNMLCQHLDIEHGHAASNLSIVPPHSDTDADADADVDARVDGDADADADTGTVRTLPTGYKQSATSLLLICPRFPRTPPPAFQQLPC